MTLTPEASNTPVAFFKSLHAGYTQAMQRHVGRENLVDAVLSIAFDSFDGNVEIQSEGQPAIACHKGCATCCTLRVTATAPEVLLIARYIRATAHLLGQAGIDLTQRVTDADAVTRGLSEAERVKLRRRCAYIHDGVCVIYQVRPLACRGHASYDKKACVEAAAGRADAVPISEPHQVVRSIVQTSMQSALRDGGYAWGAYELNHALMIALRNPDAATRWLGGHDVFADARVQEVSADEMTAAFDAIKQH